MAGSRLRVAAVLVAVGTAAVGGGALGPAGAAAGGRRASVAASPRIRLSFPGTVTAATTVTLRGRVSRAPRDSTMRLETRAPTGGRWTAIAGGGVIGGRFKILWKPRTASFVMLRVALLWHLRTLAVTPAASVLVGAAPVYCAPAAPPTSLPAGDGYIVGGVYDVGGPAPGITVCQGQANTVTVAGSNGATVASGHVAAGQSYTFVLPAGVYSLTAGFCHGTATVRPGAATRADTVCDVP